MYLKRLADKELKFKLEAFGATLIVGPKWCGKTTTALQQAKSVLDLQDPDNIDKYVQTSLIKPSLLLIGENPRLIDEWQDIPVLWDTIRKDIDKRSEDGLYILTGSSSKKIKTAHTGTGRITTLKMYPMSLYESNESNGKISLKELFSNIDYDIDGVKTKLTFEELIYATCRGGWPSALFKKTKEASLAVAEDYVNQVCERDISAIDNVTRNPKWTKLILKSYSRNISTLVKLSTIMQDINSESVEFSIDTLTSYIDALERLHIITDIESWNPAIRSASSIRSSKKRCIIDPSLVVASLGLSPNYFYTDLKTFGFIFECLCIRDLKVYSSALGGEISYYHDRYDLEADCVLHLKDGRYALIEFKLGAAEIDKAANNLLKIKFLIHKYNETATIKMREPDLLLIITATDMAYTRNDGVKIIPIGCLRD